MRAAFALLLALALPVTADGAPARLRRVAASELEPLVRAALESALPPGAHVRGLVLPSVGVGEGALRVEVPSLPSVRPGRQSIWFTVTAGSQKPVRVSALADLDTPPRPMVARGSAVAVQVRGLGVTVSARGQTQAAAGVGDAVPVLLEGGHKVLSGRLVDTGTVEVTP